MSYVRHIAIITPVFNDWTSFATLVRKLDHVAGRLKNFQLSIVAVDDGSTEIDAGLLPANLEIKHLITVEVLRLLCNVGHQRAIAIGLSTAYGRDSYDAVVVMDSDGEDRPEDVAGLIAKHEEQPRSVIVAERAKRSEGLLFRGFYQVYRWLFLILTGKPISFGNFSLIPSTVLPRIVHMPEVWNNLAAAVTRSRLPVSSFPTSRGNRYAGASKMNVVSLIIHGLSAVSVHSDVAFVRVILFSFAMILVTIIGIIAAVGIRLMTDLAIPGWTTTVVGFLGVLLVQALLLSGGAVFLLLNSRSTASVIPARVASDYIKATDVLFER